MSALYKFTYAICFAQSDSCMFFGNMNFVFMKTGNITVYGKIVLSDYKMDYTLRCLEYICSVSSRLRRHGLSLRALHELASLCLLT